MNAKEMFEKLGFIHRENNDGVMCEKYFGGQVELSIYFNKMYKELVVGGLRRNGWRLKYEIILAVVQQCKELGWLNE